MIYRLRSLCSERPSFFAVLSLVTATRNAIDHTVEKRSFARSELRPTRARVIRDDVRETSSLHFVRYEWIRCPVRGSESNGVGFWIHHNTIKRTTPLAEIHSAAEIITAFRFDVLFALRSLKKKKKNEAVSSLKILETERSFGGLVVL